MRTKLSPPQVIAIVLLAWFTVFITWQAKSLEKRLSRAGDASNMVSKKAADFSLPALDDRTVSLSDYRGKQKVVVSYWATWCEPCRLELPMLASFYKKYHKDSSNFEILAISIDDDRAAAEAYAASAKLPFPVLFDPDNKVADAYSVDAIPSLFVIDPNGTIVYGNTGMDQSLEVALAIQLGIKWNPMDRGADDDKSSH